MSDSARGGSAGLDVGRLLIVPDAIMKVILAEAKRTLGSNAFRREVTPPQVQQRLIPSSAAYGALKRQDKVETYFKDGCSLSAGSSHADARLIENTA